MALFDDTDADGLAPSFVFDFTAYDDLWATRRAWTS